MPGNLFRVICLVYLDTTGILFEGHASSVSCSTSGYRPRVAVSGTFAQEKVKPPPRSASSLSLESFLALLRAEGIPFREDTSTTTSGGHEANSFEFGTDSVAMNSNAKSQEQKQEQQHRHHHHDRSGTITPLRSIGLERPSSSAVQSVQPTLPFSDPYTYGDDEPVTADWRQQTQPRDSKIAILEGRRRTQLEHDERELIPLVRADMAAAADGAVQGQGTKERELFPRLSEDEDSDEERKTSAMDEGQRVAHLIKQRRQPLAEQEEHAVWAAWRHPPNGGDRDRQVQHRHDLFQIQLLAPRAVAQRRDY